MRLIIILLLFSTCYAQTKRTSLLGRVNVPSATAKDSAKFNLSQYSVTVSGWVNVFGDPSTGVRTGTGGLFNTITITTISTNSANWNPYGGACAYPDNGVNTAGFYPAAVTQQAYYNAYIAWNPSTSSPQVRLGGLSPSKTYTLTMSGSDKFNSTTSTDYYVKGNGGSPTGPSFLVVGNNSASGVTFTGVTPNSSGQIDVYVRASPSGSPPSPIGMIGGITVKEE